MSLAINTSPFESGDLLMFSSKHRFDFDVPSFIDEIAQSVSNARRRSSQTLVFAADACVERPLAGPSTYVVYQPSMPSLGGSRD